MHYEKNQSFIVDMVIFKSRISTKNTGGNSNPLILLTFRGIPNVNMTKNNQIRSILYSIRGIVKQNKTKVQIFFHVCAMVFKMLRNMHLFIALYSCHWLNQRLGKKEINNQVKRFPGIH